MRAALRGASKGYGSGARGGGGSAPRDPARQAERAELCRGRGVRCALLEAAGEEGTPRDCQGRTLHSLWLVLSETQAQKSGDLAMAVES